MEPTPPTQKRKRGRPSRASLIQAAIASQDVNEQPSIDNEPAPETDVEEEQRPRKRGRPRKSLDSPLSAAVKAGKPKAQGQAPRKRGRPSLKGSKELEIQDEPDTPQSEPQKKTRGRKPAPRQDHQERDQPSAPSSPQEHELVAPPRRKRGRPSLKDLALRTADEDSRREQENNEEPQASVVQHTEQLPRRKRGRPSLRDMQLSEAQRNETLPNGESPTEQPPRRKRGRPSLRDMQPSEAQNKGSQKIQDAKQGAKRRGRPPSNGSTPIGRKDIPQPPGRRASGRGRPPKATATSPAAGQDEADNANLKQQSAKSRPNRLNQPINDDGEPEPPPSPPKPYTHVAPHVRRVRQSVIESKWSPLTGSSLSAVSSILHLAHRPILQRLSNTKQRRAHTSTALRLVTHRIGKKISRGLPFPPASMPASRGGAGASTAADVDGGRETELNFESVLDGKQSLERQLDPALHAVELLTREKERMERELERDYEALQKLEAGARAQAREQRGLLKKAHVLAPGPSVPEKEDEEKELIFSHDGPTSAGNLFNDLNEPELRRLAIQLGDHVESMRTNLQQTEGIVPEVARSKAALQEVLLKHLDQAQYENVVLG